MSFWNNVRKYIAYVFDTRSFRYTDVLPPVSGEVARTTASSSVTGAGPALIIHGIMPRAGTVYVGQLMRLHPDLYALPRDLWELPLLQLSKDVLHLQRKFLRIYEQNADKMASADFLEIVGAGMLAYLREETPMDKRILFKVPSVQYLHYFWTMYPNQQLMLLTRDGRDVVDSTVRTWPQISFPMACLRWKRAANMVYQFHEHHIDLHTGYWLARFEDAVQDPETFIREACHRFALDVARYPFEQIKDIRIRGSSRLSQQGRVTWNPKEKPAGFAPIGHWQNWPPHRKWLFKWIAGDMLVKLGYCKDLTW
jgi:hypothetical protein